jgi:hypothetical protein
LLGQQIVEILLLRDGGPEYQRDPVKHFAGVDATEIGAGLGQAMNVALQSYHLAGANVSRDAIARGGITHTGEKAGN